ncbi:MAG: DUF4892 domain-containing protein [Pseudohongiellaceae bacterium]
MRCPVIATLILLLSAQAGLAQSVDEPGDYAGFTRFPDATVTEYRRSGDTVYRLPLGRMQRVDGQVAPGRSERLRGDLYRITYEIPDGFTAEDAFEHHREQLLSTDEVAQYECQGRGCGSSNYWANDVFGNRVLYGPVEGQYYMASSYRSNRSGRSVQGYAALYTVTRGNRRVYAHLDFLEMPQGDGEPLMAITPDAILRQLEQSQAVGIPRLAFDADDELIEGDGIELLVDALQRDTLLEVYVVAHLRESGVGMERLLERSAARAEAVVDRLVEEGVGAGRVSAHGAGPLAPWCLSGDCRERVELVLQP